jgi:hypothetical protein
MRNFSVPETFRRARSLLGFLLLVLAACGPDGSDPSPPPVALINLGDSLTNGVQSGTVNELTQAHGFAPLLAGQLARVRPLDWNNPLLDPATGDRLAPGLLPHNLGVSGATAQSLVEESSGTGNLLLDRLLRPIPDLAGRPVSQLEAARLLAAGSAGRPILFTLWIGNNDLLGAVTAEGGSALTASRIEAFLADAAAGHDLAAVRGHLSQIVETLRAVPESHLFIANLPETPEIGFLFDRADLESLALFPAPDLSALTPGAAIGLGPFLAGIAPFLGTDNATLNSAVAAVAALDGNVLDAGEAALLSSRIAAINEHIRALAELPGVTLVDAHGAFAALTAGTTVVAGRPLGKTLGAGGAFSLDGIHPSHTGHALVANLFIEAMNESLGLGFPPLDLAAVQAADPFFDRDGDGFAPGPGPAAVAPALLPLADCDDADPTVLPPVVSGGLACP